MSYRVTFLAVGWGVTLYILRFYSKCLGTVPRQWRGTVPKQNFTPTINIEPNLLGYLVKSL